MEEISTQPSEDRKKLYQLNPDQPAINNIPTPIENGVADEEVDDEDGGYIESFMGIDEIAARMQERHDAENREEPVYKPAEQHEAEDHANFEVIKDNEADLEMLLDVPNAHSWKILSNDEENKGSDNARKNILFQGNDSFANYQMKTALKSTMKREERLLEEQNERNISNPEPKQNQLNIIPDKDEIGEVAEWAEKSAGVNADENQLETEGHDSDDFEGLFGEEDNNQAPKTSNKDLEHKKETVKRNAGIDQYKNPTVAEISMKYDILQNMVKANNDFMQAFGMQGGQKELMDLILGIDEKDLEGEDIPTMMEKIYQGEEANMYDEFDIMVDETQKVEEELHKEAAEGIIEIEKYKVDNEVEQNTDNIEDKAIQNDVIITDKTNDNDNTEVLVKKEDAANIEPEDNKKADVNQETADWEAISKMNLANLHPKEETVEEAPAITFNDVWGIFTRMDLSEQKKQVAQDINVSQGFFQKLISKVNQLPEKLVEEKSQFLALAKIPYDEKDPFHFLMLSTIYQKLTGYKGIVERFGSHWEVIGFQGTDPVTDLRGAGILGLIQLLAMVSQHEVMARTICDFSRDEKSHFPFCVCGINMTQIVKELLREGKLNDVISYQRNVVKICNDLYFAVFDQLFKIYRARKYTINEYPLAQKEVVEIARKDPVKMIEEFQARSFFITK